MRWPQSAWSRWAEGTSRVRTAGKALSGMPTRLNCNRPDQLGRPYGVFGVKGSVWVRGEEYRLPSRHRLGHVRGLRGIPCEQVVLRWSLLRLGPERTATLVTHAFHGTSCSWSQWGQRTTFRGGADLLGISHSWPGAVCH